MTTVPIVDDQDLQRFDFRVPLEAVPEFDLVGEAAHGSEVVRKTAELWKLSQPPPSRLDRAGPSSKAT
jgi:hypothetical protein